MSSKVTEIYVREQTKLVLKYLEDSQTEKAQQVILKNKEILRYNFGLINFVPLIPRIRFSKRIPRTNDALKMVIDSGFRIYSDEDDVNELLFFAAAKCSVDKLKYCIETICQKNPDDVNQVREGDTALMFFVKYGNIADEKYPECMKMLIEAGIDVNRNDYFSHNPLLFLTDSYKRHKNRPQKNELVVNNLRKCIEMLLETKAINIACLKMKSMDMTAKDVLEELEFRGLDYSKVSSLEEDKDKLFKYLVDNKEKAFIESKVTLKFLDDDDGNNTFLQLSCEKNLHEAAKFLIKQGADLWKTTERNPKSPLEIAARRNNSEIFDTILSANDTIIGEELFLTFLRNRPKHIKARYFDEILKHKYLDMNIKSNVGNTPLHYAIIFSSTEAITKLLQRGASLTVENNSQKCPLDYISAEDFENYLDRCIIPDNYNDITNGKYELALNYRDLIETDDKKITSELVIVEKICNSPKLCHLVNHPLLSSFINIKWKLVEPMYQKLFIFHMIFYVISILSFINLNLLNYLSIPLALIYSTRIWSFFNWKNNKLNEGVDIAIAAILFLSYFISNNFIRYNLGITATIFMAFSFHLVWRFSPEFSHIHVFLINILSALFTYLFYILSLILFFGAAFHILYLVRNENQLGDEYSNFFLNNKIISPSFYLLCVFGVFLSVMIVLTVINSVTFLQQNAENIKNNFQIVGIKNTLIFLKNIENLFLNYNIIKNPFIFDASYLATDDISSVKNDNKKKSKKAKKNKKQFVINFYLNTNKFSFEKLLSVNLTDANVLKIRKTIKQ